MTTASEVMRLGTALDAVLAATPEWEGDGLLTCVRVHDVTPDIRSFVFACPGRRFRFEPGQYVTVALPELPGVSRCYTITSPPTRPDTIAITVKRGPRGEFSPVLHDRVRPGTQVWMGGPFGTFSMRHHPAERHLFVSAGSGITPVLSMLRTMHDLARGADVAFVHFARTPADIPFAEELAAIAAADAGVRLTFVVEDHRQSGPAGPRSPWHALRGLVSAGLLGAAVPDAADREAFVCGPGPFMTAAHEALRTLGLPDERYHEESFVLADHSAPAGVLVEAADGSVEVTSVAAVESDVATFTVAFSRTGTSFPCRADQHVLEAAWAHGLTPMSSCSQGLCGTCKVMLTEGTVDMQHQGGIRPREIDAGKVLICCSTPTSDLVIDA
ncbi:2Fe-2S iron-sulfur cluster-binding protein [Actinomycetota bacterium]